NKLKDVEVYEYGHGGYDMADQLHLIHVYKDDFDLIDYIIIYLKFENDLKRSQYVLNHDYVNIMNSFRFRIREKIKLLRYIDRIGLFEPFRQIRSKLRNNENDKKNLKVDEKVYLEYLDNFKTLIQTFGINKEKTAFLLDKNKTHKSFLDYCDQMGYNYIDIGAALEESKKPTTLIYDKHWNNNGRSIIASVIIKYAKKIGLN
ncbi:MAG: hypothetical protein QM490_03110, partial [Candidatus Gracilibacteria bacterium]